MSRRVRDKYGRGMIFWVARNGRPPPSPGNNEGGRSGSEVEGGEVWRGLHHESWPARGVRVSRSQPGGTCMSE